MSSYYEKFPDGKVVCIDEEIPFEIPEGWEWARIKHICSMQAGKNIASSEISSIVTSTKVYPCFGGNGLRGYVSRCNAIGTYPIIGRQGALCGNVNIASGEFYATEHAVVTDNYNQTDVKWLFWFLTALNLNQYATATAQPGLAVSNIIEVLLPIPPRKEQAAIAQTLDRIEPIINRYDESETNLSKLNNAIKIDLQKSILQEAIQGNLVPQNPDEEPAKKLLERVNAEKLQLVKGGKIKAKEAVSSIIFKGDDNKYYEKTGKDIVDITEDIPFDIPDSWSWCRLGTIFQHNTGKALNRADQKGKLLTYITTSNLYWDSFELDNLRQMCFTDDEIIKCTVQKGDLLVCEGGDIGRAAIWPFEEPVRIQNHIHRLRPYSAIATRFFYYTIAHFKDSGVIGGKGIGIQGLSSGALHKLLLPVPPMAEQYRIIEKLDKTLASIMRR